MRRKADSQLDVVGVERVEKEEAYFCKLAGTLEERRRSSFEDFDQFVVVFWEDPKILALFRHTTFK